MLSRSTGRISNLVKSTRIIFPSLSRANFSAIVSPIRPCIVSRTCSIHQRLLATQAESRLADILKQEIASETKVARQRVPQPQTTIPGFHVKTDEAEVVLTKKHEDESIKITFSVNNSVDPDGLGEEGESAADSDSSSPPALISRPEFEVEVSKGSQKLIFQCYIERPFQEEDAPPPHANEPPEEDIVRITGIASYSGEPGDTFKVFSVSGDHIDAGLYDSLIEYLEERGIDNEFLKNLTGFATHYEHTQYVALLHKIKDFVGSK